MIKIIFLFCYFFVSSASASVISDPDNLQTVKSVEQRLLELEQEQKAMEKWYSDFYLQSQGRVSPFLGEKIALGGFFETGVTDLYGVDTKTQLSANSNTLGINIAADFTDNVRFVSQFLTALGFTIDNPNNNPNATPSRRAFHSIAIGSTVAQGYVEFSYSEIFNIQSGLGYAPYGHAYQLREPVLFIRRTGPQMINSTDIDTVGIANPLWSGLHIYGLALMPHGRSGYDVYTFTPFSNAQALGVGGRLWWEDLEHITFGISTQSGEETNNSYFSYGTDLNLKYDRVGMTVEYAHNKISGDNPAAESYYAEPYYTFYNGEFLIYLAADYINLPQHTVASGFTRISDAYKKWELGGGINWLPLPNTRFRLGYLKHDYVGATAVINGQDRDCDTIDFSTGIAF